MAPSPYPFVLLHYGIMLICTLAASGGATAPMELNDPSKKANLTPLLPTPAPRNICQGVMRTHKWTLTSSCRGASRPICAQGEGPGIRGAGGGGLEGSLHVAFVNGLLIMRPHPARADALGGGLLSGVPSARREQQKAERDH